MARDRETITYGGRRGEYTRTQVNEYVRVIGKVDGRGKTLIWRLVVYTSPEASGTGSAIDRPYKRAWRIEDPIRHTCGALPWHFKKNQGKATSALYISAA